MIAYLAVLALSAVPVFFQGRGLGKRLAPYIGAAWFIHICATAIQIWITREIYHGGDLLSYHYWGTQLAELMRIDMGLIGPEVINLVFQTEVRLPLPIRGAGTSTGTMYGFTGLLCYALSDEIQAVCLAFTVFSFSGKLAVFEMFRERFPSRLHTRLAIAALLVPSVVFWSSGIVKEAVAVGGVGWLVLGLHRLMTGRRFSAVIFAVIGGLAVALVKPYVLFALIVGVAFWVYLSRVLRRDSRLSFQIRHMVIGGGFALLGLVLLGYFFPEYALEQVVDNAADLQEVGARVTGGSSYSTGSPGARSLGSLLGNVPWALVSSLFRPFIFEAHNAPAFVGSLETTALLVMLGLAIRRRSPLAVFRSIVGSPTLLFCGTFVITMSIAVGLASTNLGTLSRYRVPMLPFLWAITLVTYAGHRTAAALKGPARPIRSTRKIAR